MEAIAAEREYVDRGVKALWKVRGGVAHGGVAGAQKAGEATALRGGDSVVKRVLAARGLVQDAEVTSFLRPSLGHLHDPSLMPGLDRAAERMLRAARGGEAIVIYGDYDVDGVTATAILYHTLLAIAPACVVSTYVPHRIEEGYGLNSAAIEELARAGAKLIVSVDCGVTAVEPARVARACGLDLIITDHHHPPAEGEPFPDAYEVVHPRRSGSVYPFGDLCGAGVAYKLAWRLCTLASGGPKVADSLRGLLLELLGLCSLGVIADVVPMLGENRVIAAHGLGCVKRSKIPGLRALVEASGLGGEKVESEDVGFKLAPRLNACGRLGHAREAVELFTTARGERATEIARRLTGLNDERRRVEAKILEQACELVEARGMHLPGHRAIVLAHEEWHAGVVGIVCSRLVERYHRPAVLLCKNNDELHGSARSVDGFNLHGALVRCAEHLTVFGGHDMAAGMRLNADRLEVFASSFVAVCNEGILAEHLTGRVCFDCDVTMEELSRPQVEALKALGPFGRCNPEPSVRLVGVRLVGRPTTFGADSTHVKFTVTAGDSPPGGRAMMIIAWRLGELASEIPVGRLFDLVVKPKISSYNGVVECELIDFSLGH